LAERFDERNLFLDVATIKAGADFGAAIEEALDHILGHGSAPFLLRRVRPWSGLV